MCQSRIPQLCCLYLGLLGLLESSNIGSSVPPGGPWHVSRHVALEDAGAWEFLDLSDLTRLVAARRTSSSEADRIQCAMLTTVVNVGFELPT